MLAKEHLIFSTTTVATIFSVIVIKDISIEPEIIKALFIGSAIGCLIPDLDSETSTMGRKLKPLSKLLNFIFDILDGGKEKSMIHLSNGVCFKNHRRYMHDITVILPIAFLLCLRYPLLYGFFLGYISHLFLDSFTSLGMPFFYFFNKKLKRLPIRVKTNSFWAKALTLLLSFSIPGITYFILNQGL